MRLSLVLIIALGLHQLLAKRTRFGHNNSRVCHCGVGNECQINGCAKPYICEQLWIGPNCQHLNAFMASQIKERNYGKTPMWAFDLTDDTCAPPDFAGHIEIDLINSAVEFTWFRIEVQNPIPEPANMKVRLSGSDGTVLEENASYKMFKLMEGKSYFLRSSKKGIIFRKVEFYNLPKNLCRIELSGGYFLPVMDKTVQSSTAEPARLYNSKNAVTSDKGECSVTKGFFETNVMGWWEAELAHPARVSLHSLIGPIHVDTLHKQCPLNNFEVSGWRGQTKIYSKTSIQHGEASNDSYSDIHTVGMLSSELVTRVRYTTRTIAALTNWTLWDKCEGVFSICDTQITGESECPPDHTGYDCEPCDHCRGGVCDMALGCVYGCLTGFRGILCRQPCTTNHWGPNCEEECPEHCKTRDCDSSTGLCRDGCKPGRYGGLCERKCLGGCKALPGGDTPCDDFTGECHLCREGYYGIFCQFADQSEKIWKTILVMSIVCGTQLGLVLYLKSRRIPWVDSDTNIAETLTVVTEDGADAAASLQSARSTASSGSLEHRESQMPSQVGTITGTSTDISPSHPSLQSSKGSQSDKQIKVARKVSFADEKTRTTYDDIKKKEIERVNRETEPVPQEHSTATCGSCGIL